MNMTHEMSLKSIKLAYIRYNTRITCDKNKNCKVEVNIKKMYIKLNIILKKKKGNYQILMLFAVKLDNFL